MVTAEEIEQAFKPNTSSDVSEILEYLKQQGTIINIEGQRFDNEEEKLLVTYSELTGDFSRDAEKLHELGWIINGFRSNEYDEGKTRVWLLKL